VTVATPPPIVDSQAPVVAPEARIAVAFDSRRTRAAASYQYTYTSLGPRIGYGNAHIASAELSFRPHDGNRFRDFWVRGLASFAYGATPVAAEPPLATGEGPPPPPPTGTLTTYTAVAGLAIDYPIVRGIAVTGGFDIEYLRAVFDPVPVAGAPEDSLRTIWTVGIAGVLSSDPRNTVRREPEDESDERAPRRPTDAETGYYDARAATSVTGEASPDPRDDPRDDPGGRREVDPR
jgi:hypothetical protein